jgi:cytoskeletal protein CcmA (bactofilin family)
MKRSEVLKKLEERLARGEISEKTYLDIKGRYETEPEEADAPEETAPFGPGLESSIQQAVARAQQEAARAAQEAMRVAGEAMRSVNLAGFGARVSEDSIKIMGSGTVSGNPVKTREFRAAGSASVKGNLECESVRVSGSCDFDGDVRCREFRTAGSSRIAGSLSAGDVEASGALEIAKDLEAADVSASGSLHVSGNAKAQDFSSSGSIRIDGELKADDVSIELGGSSRVKSIECADLSVRAGGGFLTARGDLTAESIKGQDIDLVRTTAGYVEGQDVRIGPHCQIDVVVAQELVVHESSEVKERRGPNA